MMQTFFLELIRNVFYSLIWEFKVKESQYFTVLSSAIARRAIKFSRDLFRRSDADCRLVSSIFKSHAERIYLSSAAQKCHFRCRLTAVTAVYFISQSTDHRVPSWPPFTCENRKIARVCCNWFYSFAQLVLESSFFFSPHRTWLDVVVYPLRVNSPQRFRGNVRHQAAKSLSSSFCVWSVLAAWSEPWPRLPLLSS